MTGRISARAVIAEDEQHLAEYLRARLHELWPELEIDAVAKNGIDALSEINKHKPQVAFLDIKMPGLSGLEVASRLLQSHSATHIVFVTAFDDFAVDAFEREAADYLLKPVADDRLLRTISRLKARLEANQGPPEISALLAALKQGTGAVPGGYLRWIRAGSGNQVRQIAVEDVLYFDAADKYTRVVTAGGESLIRLTIKELVDQLDPAVFWQVHRGTIVNVPVIEATLRDANGQLSLRLKGWAKPLQVSRAYMHLFRQM
jgi:DNA-binding LytR/AlgR family response regulator